MRGRHLKSTVAVTAILGALGAAAPAGAAIRTDIRTSGQISVRWHGDPARGCAEHGVCDVTGSVTVRPRGNGVSEGISVEPEMEPLATNGGVIRVLRGDPAAPAGTCVDRLREVNLELVVERAARGRRRVSVGGGDFSDREGTGLDAGRCAGPRAADLRAALPARTFPGRVARRGSARFDLAGTRRFVAGPFSGEVVSTVVIHRRRSSVPDRDPFGGVDPASVLPRPARVAALQLELTVRRATGTLVTAFGGGPAPACSVLDACELTGSVEVALRARQPDASILLVATGPPSALRRPGLRGAVAALRAGRLRLRYGGTSSPELRASVTSAAQRAGTPGTCRDTARTPLPALTVRRAGDRLRFTLKPDEDDLSLDPLRTRCPGPSVSDGGALVPVAAGSLPIDALARRSITLRLAARPAGPGPFSLTRSGELRLRLQRRAAVAGVQRGDRL